MNQLTHDEEKTMSRLHSACEFYGCWALSILFGGWFVSLVVKYSGVVL